MGIIISSFIGCGKTYLANTHGNKVKILDASNMDKDNVFNHVMNEVENYDIVFISSNEDIRDIFNENNVDYDIFYPAKERRGEFIENQVRKRTKPTVIRDLDKNFEKWVDDIDDDDSPNCYKHKLSNQGEFIGNSPIIMQYINSINHEQNSDAVAQPPRSEETDEES